MGFALFLVNKTGTELTFPRQTDYNYHILSIIMSSTKLGNAYKYYCLMMWPLEILFQL